MSKAIELAEWLEESDKHDIDYGYASELVLIEAELRRLAAIEQKYLAIMAQEPVAWVTMQLPDPQKGVITDRKFAEYYSKNHNKLTALYLLEKDD